MSWVHEGILELTTTVPDKDEYVPQSPIEAAETTTEEEIEKMTARLTISNNTRRNVDELLIINWGRRDIFQERR